MVDFWQTIAGHELAASLKNISRELSDVKNKKKEDLASQIYSQLVVREFYNEDGGLSYEDLAHKAREAADAFFSEK